MKKKFLKSLGLGVALLMGVSSSAQCDNVNGDMETILSPVTGTNAWINNDLVNWNVSHGTPSPGTTPSNNIWMWSYQSGATVYGEGIYTGFSFVSGQTYELTYRVWKDATSNPASTLRVELTNGLTPYFGTAFNIPAPASQNLTTQTWAVTGWTTVTETFVATSNYSQLWFYPFLAGAPTPNQAACRIDDVCIRRVETDPCAFEPVFEISYENPCSPVFTNTTSIPYGLTVLETYWDFGDGTTGTGNTVSHYYVNGGVYDVCMTVWVINEDGKCCQLRYCKRIEVEGCDPCKDIEGVKILHSLSNPFNFSAANLPSGLYSLLGYHWDFGDGTTGTGQNVTHTYTAGGTYTVCLTVYYYNPETKECCSFTVCTEVDVRDVVAAGRAMQAGHIDGENLEKADVESIINTDNTLTVSPNPSNGVFQLELDQAISVETITVYDQTGKVVYSNNNAQNTNRMNLDLTNLKEGSYLIIVNEQNELSRKFAKVVIQ